MLLDYDEVLCQIYLLKRSVKCRTYSHYIGENDFAVLYPDICNVSCEQVALIYTVLIYI